MNFDLSFARFRLQNILEGIHEACGPDEGIYFGYHYTIIHFFYYFNLYTLQN